MCPRKRNDALKKNERTTERSKYGLVTAWILQIQLLLPRPAPVSPGAGVHLASPVHPHDTVLL